MCVDECVKGHMSVCVSTCVCVGGVVSVFLVKSQAFDTPQLTIGPHPNKSIVS